jgi:hypothetical protein
MTRAVVLLLAAFVAWPQLGAQANPPSAQPARTEATDNRAQHTIVVTGCLTVSHANGAFLLTDANGREFVLAGNTDSLSGHNQQEAQVTGQQALGPGPSTQTSALSGNQAKASSAEASAGRRTLIGVTETKIVSDHCAATGGGGQAPSSGVSDPPSQEQDSRGSLATAGDAPSVQAVALADETATGGTRLLPQTSTILPLLGLIGLGSLVVGFFARR